MKERLQKILSAHGVCSRRAAENWIMGGRVTVNGEVARLGDSADEDQDRIEIDGVPLPQKDEFVYIMLHKPRGYITTLSDEKGRKTVVDLVDCGCRVYPVGRLDYLSEGLLLLTNDGAFADRMMHPHGEIPKTYHVTVRGELAAAVERLQKPIVLDGYQIKTPYVRKLRSSADKLTLEIRIYEGRNRQIRRMCEQAGLQVCRLCRVQEGSVQLGALPVGKWRYLTKIELQALLGEQNHEF